MKELRDDGFHYHPVRKLCCVYALVLEGKVVYIGQTTNLHSRIISHEGNKKFDQVWIRNCQEYELDRLEAEFIHKYKPIDNKTFSYPYPPDDGRRINLSALNFKVKYQYRKRYANAFMRRPKPIEE